MSENAYKQIGLSVQFAHAPQTLYVFVVREEMLKSKLVYLFICMLKTVAPHAPQTRTEREREGGSEGGREGWREGGWDGRM